MANRLNLIMDELLEIVDTNGNVVGIAPRSVVHGNPSLIHRVVHVLVFDGKGRLLLQKRSMAKDVAPGRWDTSVGGHVDPGEEIVEAAGRELAEELGVENKELKFLYSYMHSNSYETELVYTYSCVREDGFAFNKEEIDEIRFWDISEIKSTIGLGVLSDNFEHEFANYLGLATQG